MDDRSLPYRRRYGPDLFFPIGLIMVGIVWMLVNAGQVPLTNVLRLIPYWPLLLIAAGLSIILRRVHWALSGLLWLGMAGLALLLIIAPPAFLPQPASQEFRHKTIHEPIDNTRSANVRLDLTVHPTRVYTLQNSDDLLYAEIDYMGNLSYSASGSNSQKEIRLDNSFGEINWSFPMGLVDAQDKRWEIGLSPKVPLRLQIDNGTGSSDLDLSGLQIEALTINGGTGSTTIKLPEDSPSYDFKMDASTGSMALNVPDGATFNLDVKCSTGSLNIDLPADAGVQVQVRDGGLGSLNLPDGFQKVRGGDDKEGTWENAAFASSRSSITIILDMSTGSVNIK